ncbi:GxxExxY protein [Granulicella tundricola]|uniref:GxxExxY protein n=1 Tax=Granulicella tundricola (strain ATCC BAA-1859 / DSM 23138 / MP5ACTX9) TaxID=1198114 RepID=E8WVX4_GRATM|nr:GxxExxY protein [Granulicella tundricola]ADW70733.1 hypothetical protein AciX9_3732 [Granulicella tundricola MP5ACTX9]
MTLSPEHNGRFQGASADITERIIGIFYDVFNELGYGFLESVYKEAMRVALLDAGLSAQAEANIPVYFRGAVVGIFKADLIVEQQVILELKTAEVISKAHEGQLTHHLMSSNIEVGLILNFGESPKFRRILLTNDRKKNTKKKDQ